jgi:hypothetical protein
MVQALVYSEPFVRGVINDILPVSHEQSVVHYHARAILRSVVARMYHRGNVHTPGTTTSSSVPVSIIDHAMSSGLTWFSGQCANGATASTRHRVGIQYDAVEFLQSLLEQVCMHIILVCVYNDIYILIYIHIYIYI